MNELEAAFTVASAQGDYTVEQFSTLDRLFESVAAIAGAFVVADETVAKLYASSFERLGTIPVYMMPATESEKTLAGVERALLALQAAKGSKSSTIVAIGGGIVQDVATLTAHLWYRGIDFVYVPTTLLSMADSCIGAKSAINLGSFKNQIGTFQSPRRVLACAEFITTLSDDAVASGYGEIVKLAIVESEAALRIVRDDVARDGFRGPNVARHIRMSLETKRKVIEIDEYERDLRKTLNFGHTFGHALESVVDNEVPHGIAVAWGVDIASYVASRTGVLSPATFDELHEFLGKAFRYRTSRPYSAAAIVAAMSRDKKASAGSVTLVLPSAIGKLELVPTPIDAALEKMIGDYLDVEDIFTA